MIKGWRNNPQWVQHFEAKAAEKTRREIERIKARYQIEQYDIDVKMALERVKESMQKVKSS